MEEHLKVYFYTVDVVSKVATAPPESQLRKDEEQKFWQLYHGSLVLVEDEYLRLSKAEFANCLQDVEFICAQSEFDKDAQLRVLASSFANTARKSLANNWGVEPSNTYTPSTGREDWKKIDK